MYYWLSKHAKYEVAMSYNSNFMDKVKAFLPSMYVCMYASNFLLLRSTLPDPKGDRTGTNEPHYRSGEGGSEAFTVWINVRFSLNICTGEGPAFGMRPRD